MEVGVPKSRGRRIEDSVSTSLPHTYPLRFPTQASPAVDRSSTVNIDTSEGGLIQCLTRLGNMVEEAMCA